jgi:hypothetical protein
MTVNLHVEIGIEPAGNGMCAVGILYLNLRHALAGRLLVQEEIQVPQAVPGEIEFAKLRQRLQIRHE